MRSLLETRAGRIAVGILAVVAIVTAIGIVLLWPSGDSPQTFSGLAGATQKAEVISSTQGPCPGGQTGICSSLEVELADPPPNVPEVVPIELGSNQFSPDIDVGDAIRVAEIGGGPDGAVGFTFSDFERRSPMLWLALGFAMLVIFFGRLRGTLSLVGLIGSLAIVLAFIVPAIRDGSEPVLVAIFGSLAVMLVTISLAHGLGAKSVAAALGTAASLLLVATLALAFTEFAHLTGFGSEEATLLAGEQAISVQGLLLAGMVIGALGVLDDVTVSQASTVVALRATDPSLSVAELYRRAVDVGRDHITATVNTLVLAYVGASLPVLLIFSAGDIGFSEALNSEIVASEIVAMLVGSIGLIAAVPLTTWTAALLARGLPEELAEKAASEGHSHVH